MKKVIGISIVIGAVFLWSLWWWKSLAPLDEVRVIDDGEEVVISGVQKGTVCDVLVQSDITLGQEDQLFPLCESQIKKNATIEVKRKKDVTIIKDKEQRVHTVFGRMSIAEVLREANIQYDEDDITSASLEDMVTDGLEVQIINVEKKEKIEKVSTAFKQVTEKDDSRDVGYKKVIQEGVSGEKEVTHDVVFHDGKERSREIASERILAEPVDQITVVGTREKPKEYKLGKSHTGQASWYAYKGCDCAANPWLPKGSFVKVTNKANGKSVVVRINDRGPFVPGRIIDLDKTAFAKIASIGAGVIDVKMEEIKE